MRKKWDKRKIKEYIMHEANENDLMEIIEIMRAKKSVLDLEKLAAQKQKIINDVEKLF